jgi:thiamine biosynthesis lipoprotein
MTQISLNKRDGYWAGSFAAMASPCEILVDGEDRPLAERLTRIAAEEACRIEAKLSRYRSDNIIHDINTSDGCAVKVDDEVAHMLDFADRCHELSDGRFDVTSGILRNVWKFDGSDRVPSNNQVDALLPHIGWKQTRWEEPWFTLPAGMEIDLGGIGKEYAVDRTLALLQAETSASVVVNYGGDLHASGPQQSGRPWTVGIEDPASSEHAAKAISIPRGALATSGNARRYLEKDGVRYSHVLDPRTGWPVTDAPRSVTVLADTCTEAGMLATFAMLEGREAEAFLEAQGVRFWCLR